MPRTPGVFTDCPPGPRPVPVEPPPDLKLAAQLVRDAELKAVTSYKGLVSSYHSAVLKMAGGAELDPDETPAFQRSLHLLRKSPQAIALDLSEGRKILAAKKWLSTYDAIKNKKELTAAATRIAEFDEQLRRVIGDIRNEAAPYHTKVTELQRNEFSVTHNAATARGWDHWLEGRFEPDPQALDRIRGAV